MKKILITGVAGFIGSTLAEKLISKGFSVIGIDNFDNFYSEKTKQKNLEKLLENPHFSFLNLDIRNEEDLEKITGCDLVVHMAARAGVRPSIENPKLYIETNITGTQNILNWMQKQKCRNLIFSSSSSVYGNNIKVPFSESDSVDFPISPYAATKKSAELFTHNHHILYKISVLNFRLFTVYGPRQRPDLAIHKFFDKLHKNEPIEMYGEGNTGRDYTFVDDIVNGICSGVNYLLNSDEPVYEIINLGNNSPVLLSELIAEIEGITNLKFNVKKMPMQMGDVNETFADITKAKKILNYQPQTSLKEGLTKFYDWFRRQSN